MGIENERKDSYIVTAQDTAIVYGSGDLEVLATPRLVAMCEQTSRDLLGALLTPENTSVGVRIELNHLKATAVGGKVEVRARLTNIEGRKHTFALQVYDGENLIGEGLHIRVVVDRARFLANLSK